MEFDWDPSKRISNLFKHGLDFADAAEAFESEHIILDDDRRDYGEIRQLCVGLINGRMVIVAFTQRGSAYRIISLRKANDREKKDFKNRLGSR